MSKLDDLVTLRNEFSVIYSKYKKNKASLDDLKKIVLKIEKNQKEYDIESYFTEAQKLVHDFLVEVSTENIGNIENRKALNLVENVQTIAEVAQPNVSESVDICLAGMIPGSTIFMYDFIQKTKPGLVASINAEETKTKIAKVMKAAPALLEENFSKKDLKTFTDSTGMKNEDAYEISKALLKIMPEREDITQSVKLSMNIDKEQVQFDVDKSKKGHLAMSKSSIYSIVKPEDKLILEGKLGIMEEWDINHKIVIIDIDGNTYTINYDPSKGNIQKIKDNIGKEVKISREKDPTDNRKWILSKWF